MKESKGIFFIIFFFVTLSSCNNQLAVTEGTRKQSKEIDIDQYNYRYVEAIKQKLTGNVGEALKYFEQCTKINPESDASYFEIAQILIASGDINNGKKYALKAVGLEPENVWYLLLLARTYYQEANIDSAIIFYERAVINNPDKENLLLTLGNLYSDQGNYAKAATIFDSFDKKYGVNGSSTVSAIRNLVSEKKFDEALKKAELLLKEFPDDIMFNGLMAEIYRANGMRSLAMEVYKKLIERHPNDPDIQLSLCDFLIKEKSYDELFLLLNSVNLNDKVSIQDKIALSAQLLEIPLLIKDYSNQLVLELMVLEANYKEDNIVPLLRADLMVRLGRLDEAGIRLEEIIKLKPDNYYAWEKLLLVYLQQENYKMLMERGEECSKKFNRSFLAKILYASAAIENEKYSIAMEELRKAEILAGDNQDFINQVNTLKADTYYRMKDYEKTFSIFEDAIKTNSEDLTVLNNYAYYLAEQGMKLKEAEQMSKKVIEIEKDNTTFLDTYAWVLYKRGKLREAAGIMEKIINSGEKDDAEWFEHYGYILKKQRKCDKAIEYWKKAMSIDSQKTSLLKEIENCKK